MQRLIVANWKMNLGPQDASILVHQLTTGLETKQNTKVILCPPFIDLHPMARELDHKKFKLGAQNIHYADHGAFTGEISAPMLKGLADYVIVGHSERRKMGEDDKLIAKKVAAAVRSNLTPILCVGDSLNERAHDLSKKVVVDQVTAGLSLLTAAEVASVVIAYEPVWAISTGDGRGQFALPHDVVPIARAIMHTVEELYGEAGGAGMRVLYGGSANEDNAVAFLKTEGISGLLVGGASLKAMEFIAIVQKSQTLDE